MYIIVMIWREKGRLEGWELEDEEELEEEETVEIEVKVTAKPEDWGSLHASGFCLSQV